MAQWSKALGTPNVFSAGFDWRWVDGDSQEEAYVPAVPTVDRRRDAGGDAVGAARLRRHAAEPRRVRAGHLHADRQARAHAERARRSLEQLRRPQPRDDGRDRPADRQQPSVDSRHATTPSSARTSAAMYHASDRVSVWGAVNSGFRAPTLTELYRQFSVGAVTTRPNDQLAARAAGRRGSRRQHRAGAERRRSA